ncbi:MAG: hypothetical protein MJZ74_05770 [Muribaculaceae bacterium]|nr:hypothetical protein [Muribaculaceae bacterium]
MSILAHITFPMVNITVIILSVFIAIIVIKIICVMWMCRNHGNFDKERGELLQRRDYLTLKLTTSPDTVINLQPSAIGAQFQGEEALYSCSMLAAALTNLSHIYPDTKQENLVYLDKLIQIVNTPQLRKYDTMRWGEDAMETLDSSNSHVTYISHLAWMMCNYKTLGGDSRYDNLCARLCEAMNRRITESEGFNLLSYPGENIYIPDMLVAIVALNEYSKLNNGIYSSTVSTWISKARQQWCDGNTGLLVSYLCESGKQLDYASVRGSFSTLNCYYLSLIDENFAREQYNLTKQHFWNKGMLAGFNEFHDRKPKLEFDIDSGPIIFGLSPSGTAFGAGAATFFDDTAVRNKILRTAEVAGTTITWNNKKHYALANVVIVGEAIMLAMRTNTNPNRH